MANYIIHKNPSIRIDLMVRKEYYPKLVGLFQLNGCRYETEEIRKIKGTEWVRLTDISSKYGSEIGRLIESFYDLKFFASDAEAAMNDKFYITINYKRKGKKKYVREDRKESDEGRKGGDRGESADNAGSGPVDGYSGNRADAGGAGTDDSGIPKE